VSFVMFMQRLTSATHHLWRSLAEFSCTVGTLRERYRVMTREHLREARGLTLLRDWLSTEQRAQFEWSRCFDVVGCYTGKRYRICYGTGTNVHEIDDAGRPLVGWCFVPSGHLVAGDVMLAQKIALETSELAAIAVANRFPVQIPNRTHPPAVPRRAY
jgi:hypothetical protein